MTAEEIIKICNEENTTDLKKKAYNEIRKIYQKNKKKDKVIDLMAKQNSKWCVFIEENGQVKALTFDTPKKYKEYFYKKVDEKNE